MADSQGELRLCAIPMPRQRKAQPSKVGVPLHRTAASVDREKKKENMQNADTAVVRVLYIFFVASNLS